MEFIDSSAAILMGGASSRFGSDKSRCLFHTIPLYRLLHDRLATHFSSVSCILRDESPLNDPNMTTYVDLIPRLGPLGGILTALHFSDSDFCFITAVDHPFLPPELPYLLAAQLSTADIVVPLRAGKPQPLAAFYNRSCLPAIRSAIDRGDRRVRSFWNEVRVASLNIEDLLPPEQVELAFINLNYTEDYIRAQSILYESADVRGNRN